MTKKILVFLALMCIPVTVHASRQAERPYKAFDGFSLGANVGSSINLSDGHANYEYANLFGGAPDAADSRTTDYKVSERGDFVHSLEIGYTHAVTERLLFGLFGSYFFETTREIRTKEYIFSNPNNRADFPRDYGVLTRIDPRSHLSASLEPGLLVTDDLLAFVSIAYHYMNANLSSTSDLNASNMVAATTVTTNGTIRRSFNGIGVGGGMKYNIFKHCLLKVSAEWILFGRESANLPQFSSTADEITFTQNGKAQPSWINIMAGISYTFG